MDICRTVSEFVRWIGCEVQSPEEFKMLSELLEEYGVLKIQPREVLLTNQPWI